MGLLGVSENNIIYLSRFDENELLSSYSDHGFDLEDIYWSTAEHYYQAKKYVSKEFQEQIRNCATPVLATKLGHERRQKRQKDWKKNRMLMMIRAIYTKCHAYTHIAERLLATGNDMIIENSQYDYYWGCGRDRLGHNTYGKVLMNVRNKLREEKKLLKL